MRWFDAFLRHILLKTEYLRDLRSKTSCLDASFCHILNNIGPFSLFSDVLLIDFEFRAEAWSCSAWVVVVAAAVNAGVWRNSGRTCVFSSTASSAVLADKCEGVWSEPWVDSYRDSLSRPATGITSWIHISHIGFHFSPHELLPAASGVSFGFYNNRFTYVALGLTDEAKTKNLKDGVKTGSQTAKPNETRWNDGSVKIRRHKNRKDNIDSIH